MNVITSNLYGKLTLVFFMQNKTLNTKQGHWTLAKMGKKVLRPGGKELSLRLINNLDINPKDDVVEFAPGLGITAAMTLKRCPHTYVGIELNEEAASISRKNIYGYGRKIIVGNAAETGLNDRAYSKVYGEAMLTMQADHVKSKIIKEAHRILKVGGLYGIHELGLTPDNLTENAKSNIQKELAQSIKINARPLTIKEWSSLMEKEGFKVIKTDTNPMHLLEKKRIIADEGIFRTIKIMFNILTHTQERKHILSMRSIFRKYQNHLNAISIIAQKQ